MRLPFDLLSQNYVKPKLFLCETDKSKMCQLETISLNGSFKFNAYSELNFSVGRTYTNMVTGETQVNPFYDKIEALRLVYLDGFGYFEIQDPEIVSDGIKEVKNITAYGLEYSLSQKYIENLNVNTGEADSVEVMVAGSSRIIPVTLYNTTRPELSLLDLALEKIYGWSIGHVDDSLRTMSRQFEISRASVYDFIVQDICEKFNCFAVFDTVENKINLYAESLITKYIGDGQNDTFLISPPYDSIGTVSIDSYKTTKYKYQIVEDKVDKDKKTGYLIFDVAPENGARIEIVDGSQNKWKTDVYVTFENLAQEVNISYSAEDIKTVLTVKGNDDLDIREVNMGLPYIVDLSYYYTVDWMGEDLYKAYTTYLQKSNLAQSTYADNSKTMLDLTGRIAYETNRLSLEYSIADNVTSTTVGTYYVRGGTEPNYYYREVKLPDEYNANIEHYYTLSGSDLDEEKFSKLYAAIQTYFVSLDEKDVSEIEKLKDSFQFMETNTIEQLINSLSSARNLEEKDESILSFFDEMWNQLGSNSLDSLYYTPYKKIEATNKESGWDDETNDNYWRYYPVTLVLQSIERDIEDRKIIIRQYQEEYSALQLENNQIASSTSIYNNFTHEQLIRLSPFLREDEYTDDNFVETDSDTIDILMKTKQELLECGKIELSKLCEPKLAFSMDMANIYALTEFEPIIHQFQLGNLINVVIREDYVKRARLLAVDINFDDFSDFSCEFGELTNLKTQSSIHADLLANALAAGNSVASNLSYWNKGTDIATATDLKIQNGLLSAIDGIYNGDKSVLIDNHGILLRKVESNGEYSPYQIWLTNNNILVSTDAFDTAQTGIGVFEVDGKELYGILAKAVLAGYIEGSTIVGGTININDTFIVDEFGNVTMKSCDIDGYVEEDNIISSINLSPEKISIEANKISLAGKQIDLTSDNITIDSTNFSVTQEGKVTATSGVIGGWNIDSDKLSCKGTGYEVRIRTPDNAYGSTGTGGATDVIVFIDRGKDGASSPSYPFVLTSDGTLSATKAKITGNITANSLTLGSEVTIPYSKLSGAPDLDIYIAKDGTIGTMPASGKTGFTVSSAGLLQASNAVIYGAIYASNGEIAGWTIDNNSIHYGTLGGGASMWLVRNGSSSAASIGGSDAISGWCIGVSSTFGVTKNGKLYATGAQVSGKITAESGSIAGYNIGSGGSYGNALYKRVPGDSADYEVGLKATSGDTDLAFYVKTSTNDWSSSSNVFYVMNNGKLYAQNADITGKITASSGAIDGNLEIGGSLTHTRGNYKVTLRGVQSDVTNGVFYITDSSSGSNEYPVRINGDGSARFTNVTITGSSTIAAACIPNLSAAKITSGTISTDRLSSSVITTDNFSSKTLSTGNLSVTNGGNIGIWTVNSYGYLYAISGNYGVSLSTTGISHGQGGSTTWVNVVKAGQNASDIRLKKDICELESKYDNVFDNLKPIQFKYTDDFYGQGLHLGFTAQDVIETMNENGINNFAGVYEDDTTGTSYYQLQKQEFIALNTWQIQKLKQRVEELENRLYELERNDTK